MVGGVQTQWNQISYLNSNTKEVLPLLWRFWTPHQASQPGDLAKGLGIPRESDSEGQWDLITGLPQAWGKQRLHSWRTQTKSCVYKGPGERSNGITGYWTRPPCWCWRVSWGGVGSAVARHEHGGLGSSSPEVLLEVTINPTIELRRPQCWTTSGETINREGAKPSPSVENWIKVLLSMALPIRARLSFSHHQSLPSGNLHRSLNLIHQMADRRSKKGHNPTAARPKTTSQKVNHDEKAEGFVPDEGTR